MLVPTPHNSASRGDIAKTVLMPGDPLRAEYIAKKYLENVVCYNQVRGMLGFTGLYKGVKVSVQGSGMGIPSMGIYSMELFDGYDVDNIIRIGSAGAIDDNIKLRDIIVAENVKTDSNYPTNMLGKEIELKASNTLLQELKKINEEKKANLKFGNVFTSDIFYNSKSNLMKLKNDNILGVEMESAGLYTNAKIKNKNAITILTVSDSPLKGESLPAKDRQNSFNEMMEIALELAIRC